MQKFLSWDCANRSLAWSHLSINTKIYSTISSLADRVPEVCNITTTSFNIIVKDRVQLRKAIIDEKGNIKRGVLELLVELANLAQDFVYYEEAGVADVLNGSKVMDMSEIQRTRALHNFIQQSNVREETLTPGTQTVIEHQPPSLGQGLKKRVNTKSTAVAFQLAFYYINHDPSFIDPKLKNNIALREDLTLVRFQDEMKNRYKNKSDQKYHARKEHSKANFLYFIHTFGWEEAIMKIPKAYLDDVADSTMQVLAFILANNKFT
jgi:hypothetical protein